MIHYSTVVVQQPVKNAELSMDKIEGCGPFTNIDVLEDHVVKPKNKLIMNMHPIKIKPIIEEQLRSKWTQMIVKEKHIYRITRGKE